VNNPQFAPIIGQRQKQAQAHVQAAINQLSLSIYNQLATAHVASRDQHQTIDRDALRQLANDANTAAKCYFEALGVIKTTGEPTKRDEAEAQDNEKETP